jgi:hypothetical protein
MFEVDKALVSDHPFVCLAGLSALSELIIRLPIQALLENLPSLVVGLYPLIEVESNRSMNSTISSFAVLAASIHI